jgi:hypothetical protein
VFMTHLVSSKRIALCCSNSAYLFKAIVYLGKRAEDEKEKIAEGSKTQQTVISLVTPGKERTTDSLWTTTTLPYPCLSL